MQRDTKGKRRAGAALSALVIGGLFLLFAGFMLWAMAVEGSAPDRAILLVCALIFLAMVVGVLLALGMRWRELEKGEEDEARKY